MNFKRTALRENAYCSPKKLKTVTNDAPSMKSPNPVQQNGSKTTRLQNLQSQRHNLPIFSARRRLLLELQRNPTVIVIGETGCGKTTQLPQFIHEARMEHSGVIAITQPRRIAAITIAGRVAAEMGTNLGTIVGYCVRFDDQTSPSTKLKYMTDGMLLREAVLDPLLNRYTFIILDEAHERTVQTDVLFSIVKTAQEKRKEEGKKFLKVIVMSATMDVDRFSQYFNKAPVLYVEGRQFPVQVMYAKEDQSDYLFSSVVTVFQIHQDKPVPGDILVFLTGQDEIEVVTQLMRDVAKSLPSGSIPVVVFPLYASLPASQQLLAFQPTAKSSRKVIIATNVAETSVTIHGIRYVVDAGLVKARTYTAQTGLDVLKVQSISKAQAWQRCGRAGRENSGVCYRLYTEKKFSSFADDPIPEIQRCSLSSTVLQLLALGIDNVLDVDFLDKPSPVTLTAAIDELQALGAVESNGEGIKLSSAGKKMSIFPVDPRFSKAILSSSELGCTEEVLSIIAMLSVDSVEFTPASKKDAALSARRKFMSSDGDPIKLLNIFNAYTAVDGNKQWCREHFLHIRHLIQAVSVRKQLLAFCLRIGIKPASCGEDLLLVRKCLVKGLFMNCAKLQKSYDYVTVSSRIPVAIHPSSCLFGNKPDVVIFTELVQTSRNYMRGVCVVEWDWIEEASSSKIRSGHQQSPMALARPKKSERLT